MTKNELEKLADEIICLGKTLLEKAPIKQEEKIQGGASALKHYNDESSRYLCRQIPLPETYTSYSWGIIDDNLKTIKSEATQKYEQFYSSTRQLIKERLPEREAEFVDNYHGKQEDGVFEYLNLSTALYNNDKAAVIYGFEQKLNHQKNILLSIEMDEDIERNFLPQGQDVLQIIEQVFNRFHRFALQLRRAPRKDQSIPQLPIKNEYDVQYLLRAILSLHFDDIRPEEPSGSSAGSSSKADFWLDDEKMVIETKYRGSSLSDKKLKAALNTDIGDYQKIENCQTIVFFIYDPENRIENPYGFEKDFNNRTNEKLTIKTFIRPKA